MRGVLPAIGHAHAGLTDPRRSRERAAHHGGKPENLQHQGRRLRARHLRAQPGEMAAGDMTALMRDDADHLIGVLGLHQRAGMHEHIVAVDDEGVEVFVVDDVDADSLRAEACGGEDRLGVDPDQRFGLGVADEPGGVGRGRRDERGGKPADEARAEPPWHGVKSRLSQKRHGSALIV